MSPRESEALEYIVGHPLMTPADVADILDLAGREIWASMRNQNGDPTYDWDELILAHQQG